MSLHVELVAYTPNPERNIACAARLCYAATDACSIAETMTEAQEDKVLQTILSNGHDGPLEHACFTFAVDGISRALSHQLVRHRLASFNQQSQRYVAVDDKPVVVTPPTIADNSAALRIYERAINHVYAAYSDLITLNIPKEDARYVLPNAAETKIFITMNARELRHVFSLRCCNRAQWEIRELAEKMLSLVQPIAPRIFANAGAPCVTGPCPEGKMSCGKPKHSVSTGSETEE